MAQMLVTVAINAAISYGLGMIYRALQPTETHKQEGSRLSEVQITSSTEGTPFKRLWGTTRLGGQIIWSTKFLETTTVDTEEVDGGKGGGGGQEIETTTYTYSVSFAVALCEGHNRASLGRIWLDGKLLDQANHTIRFYPGSDSQEPDFLIEEKEGAGRAPAFRHTCYLVFDNLQLADWGNRIPQVTAEITRPIDDEESGLLETLARGWDLIPSAGEFVYGTDTYIEEDGFGNSTVLNVHNERQVPNLIYSLDDLAAKSPNTGSVLLVVSWFGDDLRIGECTLRPKVESDAGGRTTYPANWRVTNLTRSSADEVSTYQGSPAFGGTPADRVVREAVQNIQSRGWRCVFYPFILMDVPNGNSLPDIDGGTGQPAYPWRGRIRLADSDDDKTSAAADQVDDFFGTVDHTDYGTWDGTEVPYSGPTEWSYRRMIHHYAALMKDILADGDAFIIGSEMVGATSIRSDSNTYPFVDKLVELAGEIKGSFDNNVLVSYAADWTEYNNHRPDDGSDDVYFHLDPLWASDDIDFVSIDAYFPLSDWRDGDDHLDYDHENGVISPYNLDYLMSNVEGGELYDWYYQNETHRNNQNRTPIVDTAEGKHWVFRQKDFRNWWSNYHYNRPSGSESGSATDWEPSMKQIWFTEFGCPAVDKGGNQPNVFVDVKSSESFVPYYSSGARDDLMQRRYNEAMLLYWLQAGGTSLDQMDLLGAALGWTSGDLFAHVTRVRFPNQGNYTMNICTTGVGDEGSGKEFNDFANSSNGNQGTLMDPGGMGENGYFNGSFYRPTGTSADAGEAAFLASAPWSGSIPYYTDEFWVEFQALPGRWFRFSGEISDLTDDVYDPGNNYQTIIQFNNVWDYLGEENPDTGPIQTSDMHLWTWDARPYPAFPFQNDVWADGDNWELGHWLTGRLGSVALADLVRQICYLGGLTSSEIDVSGLYGAAAVVRGYLVEDIRSPRAMLGDLMSAYNFDGFEANGKVTFVFKNNATVLELSVDDLVPDGDNVGGYSIIRAQETDLPAMVKLTYIDESNDYNVGGAEAHTSLGWSRNVTQVSFPLVLPQEYVRSQGDVFIQEAWLSRDRLEINLPPSLVRINPGDVIEIELHDRLVQYRIVEIETGETRKATAVRYDPSVYDPVAYNSRRSRPSSVTSMGRSKVAFLDLPITRMSDPEPQAPRIAVYQNPWPGGVAIYEDDDEDGWKLNTVVRVPSIMGEIAFDFYSGPLYDWDTVNDLYVNMYSTDDSLFSSTDLAVLNGTNVMAVENDDGQWEIIQFVNAELVAEGQYKVSRLLRGQLGTEDRMGSPSSAGNRVVLLERNKLGILNLPSSKVGLERTYRYGPANVPVGNTRFRSETLTFEGLGLRPYSPVSLEAVRDYSTDDVTFSWIRRTRAGGDNWGAGEVPLNEEYERYEIDILDGSDVVRTFTVNSDTTKVYTSAQQTTDFGSVPDSFTYRIYQMSAVFGRGAEAEATFYA